MDDQTEITLEQLEYLVYEILKIDCPFMSGNMQDNISIVSSDPHKTVICVSGPSYDVGLWERTKKIKHTHKGNYATSVNEHGGFHSENASKHWVNRALYKACDIIAKQYGGEVILDGVDL